MRSESISAALEDILRCWLGDPEILLFSGDWERGGVMEILPGGRANLSGPRYEPPFHGLRDLTVQGSPHHVHLDLHRLVEARYVMAPCICYGMRPSFEVRFTDGRQRRLKEFTLGMAVAHPYAGGLKPDVVKRYCRRLASHQRLYPDITTFSIDRGGVPRKDVNDWKEIESILRDEGVDVPDAVRYSTCEQTTQRRNVAEVSAA